MHVRIVPTILGIVATLVLIAAGLWVWNNWVYPQFAGVQPPAVATPVAKPAPTAQPTAAPAVPTQPAPPAPTAAPQPTSPPAQPQPAPSSACNRHGAQAWSDSTKVEGHNRSPVGGLQEVCWIVIETLRASPVQGYVAVLPPKHVAWIDGHAGGTGWFINGEAEARANAEKLRREIFERDGLNPIVVHLDRGEIFPLLAELQSAPRGPAAGTSPAPGGAPAPAGPTVAGTCSGGTATGPAVVQYGPPATVVKVSQGRTQTINRGGCFPFASQQALDARWNAHVAEFRAQYGAGASVIEN